LPFVFIDHVAGFVCSDFLYVDAVAFQNLDHFPDAGDMLGGGGLEPTDAETQRVAPEGSWFFQVLAEPTLAIRLVRRRLSR
jgi:hypothetical protein